MFERKEDSKEEKQPGDTERKLIPNSGLNTMNTTKEEISQKSSGSVF